MDLVTFGEAMVRLTPPAFQRLEQAHSFDAYVGGGELNVAVAAARLGVSSRWVSRLPENALGQMIAGRAREQGVDVHVEWTGDDRAGLYFAELGAAPRASSVLYDRAASAMSRIRPGSIDWSLLFAGARWFHVSGITPALSESAAKVTAESLLAAKKAGLTVSYDLNYRSKLWSPEKARAAQEPLMEHVDVLMTTEEDTRVVFGIGAATADSFERMDADSYTHVALALEKRFGFRAVAVTLRESPRVLLNSWSAIVAADGKIHRAPRYEVEVVDRIGAGDAFSAGLIVSRLENRGWDDAVRFATATSALKHSIPGDFCLVTRTEVEQVLRGGEPASVTMTTKTRSRTSVLSTLHEVGIIPVIRTDSADAAKAVVEALVEAGLIVAEITMTVPRAMDAIASVAKHFGDKLLVGAGTVTDADTARRAADAGAEFIVTPCLVPEVIDAARRSEVAVIPGALTPTEVLHAFRLGGDMVKVFPAQNVGGASYLRALRGPFPDIPLVPTGGVTLDNVREMFDAGAAAVGVGSELISKDALARRDYAAISALATQFLAAVRKARAQ